MTEYELIKEAIINELIKEAATPYQRAALAAWSMGRRLAHGGKAFVGAGAHSGATARAFRGIPTNQIPGFGSSLTSGYRSAGGKGPVPKIVLSRFTGGKTSIRVNPKTVRPLQPPPPLRVPKFGSTLPPITGPPRSRQPLLQPLRVPTLPPITGPPRSQQPPLQPLQPPPPLQVAASFSLNSKYMVQKLLDKLYGV